MTAIQIWEKFATFWASYGPWIAVSLVPTIITGLSLSPKTAPAASWIQKMWDKLKSMLNALSVLTHKDEPGTFQLPLKLSKLKDNKAGPTLVLIMAVGLGASITSSGCGWFKKSATVATVVDCTKQAVVDKVGDLLPTVVTILETGASNWAEQLIAVGKEFGDEVLACVIDLAANRFEGEIPAGGTISDPLSPTVKALNKAHDFQSIHNWRYSK